MKYQIACLREQDSISKFEASHPDKEAEPDTITAKTATLGILGLSDSRPHYCETLGTAPSLHQSISVVIYESLVKPVLQILSNCHKVGAVPKRNPALGVTRFGYQAPS